MRLGVLTVGSVYLGKRSKRVLADEFSRLLNPTLYVSSLRQVAEYLPDFRPLRSRGAPSLECGRSSSIGELPGC